MGKPFTTWGSFYPPRPEHVLSPDRIPWYEAQGWVAQFKKNGTCSLIARNPEGNFLTKNRHNEPHKAWQISKNSQEILAGFFPKNHWTVVVAELLHNKAPGIKDTLYIHDVLVLDSEFLLGSTFMERQKILEKMFPSRTEAYSHYVISERIWRAKLLTKDLFKKFKEIENPKIDEGLVLKQPTGKLALCDIAKNNTGWQAKVRYPAKNYAF